MAPKSKTKKKTTFAVKAAQGSKKKKFKNDKKLVSKPKTLGGSGSPGEQGLGAKQRLFQKGGVYEEGLSEKRRKKEAVKQLKLKKNKSYGLIMDITAVWEKLRPRDISESQRQKLLSLAMSRVKGRIAEVVQNPKASRVLQCCMQHGTHQERQMILDEIHQGLATLSMSKYGKHLVQRLIHKTPREDFSAVFRMFPGHCTRLMKHQYGSDVMNELYCKSTELQKHELLMVCYGREFHASLVDDWVTEYQRQKAAGVDPSSFETVMKDADAVRRAGVLQQLHRLLHQVMEKGLLVNRLVHRLILEFFCSAPAAQVEDLSVTLAETGDGLLKMVHTKEGAAVSSAVLRYSDASHRKMALRGFKDYVKETAMDEWGYVVLMMAFRVVDDTKMLRKTLLQGLLENLEEICAHRYGRCILLDLLHPNCSWYLPSKVETHLRPRGLEIPVQGSEEVRVVGVSKKDNDTRRRELLCEGEPSLERALIQLCSSKTASLLKCRRGCDVLVEVARGGEGEMLNRDGCKTVQSAIVEACSDISLLTERIPKGALLQLIHLSNRDGSSIAKQFCKSLWKGVFCGNCQEWIDRSKCSVLVSLMTCGSKSVRTASLQEVSLLLEGKSVEDWLQGIEEQKKQKRELLIQKRLEKKRKA